MTTATPDNDGEQAAAPPRETGTVEPAEFATDFLIIGSGFGGSVSALRLSEKGYRVTVLEATKRRIERVRIERIS